MGEASCYVINYKSKSFICNISCEVFITCELILVKSECKNEREKSWSRGTMVTWYHGHVVLWSRGLVVWWSGGLVVWWYRGHVVTWSDGQMVTLSRDHVVK